MSIGATPPPGSVRAAVIEQLGAAPRPGRTANPAAGPGQTLVDVTVAALNPFDVWVATGAYPGFVPPTPWVPGVEGVGTVAGSGSRPEGERVAWLGQFGSLAERVAVDDAALVPVPDAVPDALAASLGVAGTAAWLALADTANMRPGESVLVLGASGAVGRLAVQSARLQGASRVIAASRHRGALAELRELGADDTVLLEAGGDWASAVAGAGGEGFDVVVDPVWGAPAAAAVEAMAAGGRLATLGVLAGTTAPLSGVVLARGLTIRAYNGQLVDPARLRDAHREVLDHAAAGRLRLPVEVGALDEVAELWARQAAGPRAKLAVRPTAARQPA